MALGRNLFIFGNHVFYEWPALFESPGKCVSGVQICGRGPGPSCGDRLLDPGARLHLVAIFRDLAAFFVALSPIFVLYGGQIMTDVPSVLLLALH